MDDPFRRVVARSHPLGRYGQKYLRAVEARGPLLVDRLEAAGRLSRVHLDRCAPSLEDDLGEVAAAASGPGEALVLLGTFYAVQFLHLNARSLERLAVDLAGGDPRLRAYRRFLHNAERDFVGLTSAYVRRVLGVLLPAEVRGGHLLCSVGTRGHQDDIDVAVIDAGGPDRPARDRAFARLTSEMLRHASALDHYIAARVGSRSLCLSPGELAQALDSGGMDFIVVTELLRAEPLAGSRRLYRRLQEEIVARCLYRPDGDNTLHEYYLRRLLGEIRALLLFPPATGVIHPKEDGLRVIAGLATACKTMEALPQTSTRGLLVALTTRRPALKPLLRRLQRSAVFLETFRHLVHLLLAQEEGIEIVDPASRANLEPVAAAMGYGGRRAVAAVDHLLVHYEDAVDAARETAMPLMEEVARHLARTSAFASWAGPAPVETSPADLAGRIAARAAEFQGAQFWDDVIEALGAPDGALIDGFADSIRRLPGGARRDLALRYADWGRTAPYALLTVLTLLARRSGRLSRVGPADVLGDLTRAFLDRFGTEPEDVRGLSRVFRSYPALVNSFLLTLEREGLERLHAALDVPIGNPEVAEARDRFRSFLGVHQASSRYVKRVLARLSQRSPSVVLALGDDAALRAFALGQLAAGERQPDPGRRRGLLGNYYDAEFLRLALATLCGVPSATVRAGFSEMTETYLSQLFDSCLREVERDAGTRLWQRDLLGIYLAGGHARRRPFDEDYDILAIFDSDRPDQRRIAERALARMNRLIARQGLVAQYRLADRTGSFVAGLDELAGILRGGDDDLFVDRHQILGSRAVAGGRAIEEALLARVIRPLIFDQAGEFAARLARELEERRRALPRLPEGSVHIKGMPGGLREIDLCIAAAAARLGVRMTGYDRLDALPRLDREHAVEYGTLREADEFFVAVRSAYRVSVAAADTVEKRHLGAVAAILGYGAADDPAAAEALFEEIGRRAAASARTIDVLMAAAAAGAGRIPAVPAHRGGAT